MQIGSVGLLERIPSGLLPRNITILLAQSFHPEAERLGVAMFEKLRVSPMRGMDSSRMLDRTPVLLGTCRHFTSVRGDAVAV